ncbi:Protein kinase superfamily protein [Perilla frutescens var. frutescens]|nr:Protein kinase superfamily protein [Perilla frutescens var. frutescens]
MGCVSSKKVRCDSPPYEDIRPTRRQKSRRLASSESQKNVKEEAAAEVKVDKESERKRHDYDVDFNSEKSRELNRGASQNKAVVNVPPARSSEGELVAAGWPSWLSSVAADAIDGWVPLRSDAYERLDKIGQGTYSNVYRARCLKTEKIVAVKKVRFDNFQAESVKFMAREIKILRMLDHPNVMKLEGIITSRLSCTIYLVFEYMEHDLAGLLSCPDIKFTDSQIKCYTRQLLSGLDHCHSRGIMHRDIKSSNILVNNEGVLKIADFGLAYFTRPKNRQPFTSRVVTLWYRPPELLLGSTNYGGEVDLWSVGCVFAELFMGRPILKGRTEVEQLHKIFRLCGTPPDEYWRTSRLPLAAMFKPQHPYDSTLRDRCRELPKTAVDLIQTLLSIEPHKRGTAASALESEYFCTRPYACDPSSMPIYPPNKEMDAKAREDERRIKGISAKPEVVKNSRRLRKSLQESTDFCKVVPAEIEAKVQLARRNNGGSGNPYKRRNGIVPRIPSKQSFDTKSDLSQASNMTQDSITSTKSVPVQMPASTSFAWDKRQKQQDVFTRLHNHSALRSQKSLDPSPIMDAYELETDSQENDDSLSMINGVEAAKRPTRRERAHLQRPGSFDSSDMYDTTEFSENDQTRLAIRRSRFHKD